jgi:hypothetical protein
MLREAVKNKLITFCDGKLFSSVFGGVSVWLVVGAPSSF